MDVLWFRLSRKASDPEATMGRFTAGRIVILLNRGDYWQCGYVISKGAAEEVRRAGLPAFRAGIGKVLPFLAERAAELVDWERIKLLTVRVDRLRQWYRPGLLCIGDAAHAMSPVAGVGINLAIQDAVAAANILATPLKHNRVSVDDLRKVQKRREWPVRVTQQLQLMIQKRLIARALQSDASFAPPLFIRMLEMFPALRRIPARLIGLGIRPEHVKTTAASPEHAPQGTQGCFLKDSAPPGTGASRGICARRRTRRRSRSRRGSAGIRWPPPRTPSRRGASPCSPLHRSPASCQRAKQPCSA